METLNIKNIFIEGCSGSGKDTLANYFREYHGYFKIRISDTIKRIICEKENLTFDELEVQKRLNPELRLKHNEVGKYLDESNGTFNRINQIINRTALDFQHEKNINDLKVCVCDARGYDNAEQLLKAGFLGFFLMRDPKEFGNPNNWTERTLSRDKRIVELAEKYHKQMVIIFNLEKQIDFRDIDDYQKNFIKENIVSNGEYNNCSREITKFYPAYINCSNNSNGGEFIERFHTIIQLKEFEHQIIDRYNNRNKK